MKLLLASVAALAAGLLAGVPSTPSPAASQKAKSERADVPFASAVRPFLKSHCLSCHSGGSPAAGLALDRFRDDAALAEQGTWGKVLERLQSRTMPPPGMPRPPEADLKRVVGWLERRLDGGCADAPNPGRVTIRRLNRLEYRNTVRDLLGVSFRAAADFPMDDVGYGFDNIGDVLSLPPLLMERYLAAAETVVREGYPKAAPKWPADPKSRAAAVRAFLTRFAKRAYRRPPTGDETNRLMKLVELGGGSEHFEQGVQLAMQAVLISPHFLFRVERDRPASGPASPLSDYELASRLSYFLWASMPDDTLLSLAGSGKLRQREVLEAQAVRMLKDPKARGLIEGFSSQWLQTRRLRSSTPDPETFPTFDAKLREAMLTETDRFFSAIMREDRSVLEFLDADYTFLNERLARHYGIPGVKGEAFRRVRLKDGRRGGVVTQAAILTLTSNPTRTSPVKRGKWILEQLLNDAPPPPPPDVSDLSEEPTVVASASLRERLEQHRADPKCASCHSRMDPLGFALENFDGIGAWRAKDGRFAIDPVGALPDGTTLKGPETLKRALLKDKDKFVRALVEKMLTYALGRGLEPYDRCTVDRIRKAAAGSGYRFSSLVKGIVGSDAFRMRAASEAGKQNPGQPSRAAARDTSQGGGA